MAVLRRAPATYADLAALPETVVGELIAGELYVSPRPARPHATVASSLTGLVMPPFDFGFNGPGGWAILVEPELHFREDAIVPDLGGWRRERIADVPFEVAYFTTAPDWVCEVLSPSTSRLDRTVKLHVYARERVPHLWFIDPLAQTIEVLALHGEHYVVAHSESENVKVRLPPFDAIELDLSILWRR